VLDRDWCSARQEYDSSVSESFIDYIRTGKNNEGQDRQANMVVQTRHETKRYVSDRQNGRKIANIIIPESPKYSHLLVGSSIQRLHRADFQGRETSENKPTKDGLRNRQESRV